MSRHRHHKVDRGAVAERDTRRRDVQNKLAAAAGVDPGDVRCETLSWLMLSLDVAKERLLAGTYTDISSWQALVDRMQSLMPKAAEREINIRWTESIGHCAKCKAVSTVEEHAAYEALFDRRVDEEVTKRLQAMPQPSRDVPHSSQEHRQEAAPQSLPEGSDSSQSPSPPNVTPLRARPPMGTSAYVAAINDAALGASPFDPPRGATRWDNNG